MTWKNPTNIETKEEQEIQKNEKKERSDKEYIRYKRIQNIVRDNRITIKIKKRSCFFRLVYKCGKSWPYKLSLIVF